MKEFDRKTLANNIKELRKNRKLNQVELAKQLNVSQQTVGAWETGRAIPGSDTLDMLANYFGVTPAASAFFSIFCPCSSVPV